MDKRFIEEDFPVKEISEISVKEKNITQGSISALHIWWARRPLASSRATNYAALIPAPKTPEEWEKKRQFIIELSKWENSLNPNLIGKAREDILAANGGKPPRVLDCFAGGGSIPLEALRLGCEAHAIDYNPVATLILKCTLEYPLRYRKVLLEDIEKWGSWVLEAAEEEIGRFYPTDENGSIPVAFLWAETIPCQNPSCGVEIPLIRQFWLANKDNKKVALFPYEEGKEIKFKIVGDGYEEMPRGFNPSKGTVLRAIAVCPACGSVIDDKMTKKLFQEGKAGERMLAVVLYKPGVAGKGYRLVKERDIEVFKSGEKYLEEKREKLKAEWGIDPVPDESLDKGLVEHRRLVKYGRLKWGDIFNSRQKLALITFTEKTRQAYKQMIEAGYEKDYAKIVAGYLGVVVDRLADYQNQLCRWYSGGESVGHIFERQALPMVWDYTEINPFSPILPGPGNSMLRQVSKAVAYICQIPESPPATIRQASATELPYPDDFFDAVFTDPPYYDNINYAGLSDFFYVWLKRSIGDICPEFFLTPLVPKTDEIVSNPSKQGSPKKAKEFFESLLKKSFKEIARVLKPDGIVTIVYAHKSISGWETLANSFLESGLIPTASWTVNTESKVRINAQGNASLSSAVYFVCRKGGGKEIGWFNEVIKEMEQHITEKLQSLWKEGISGGDYLNAGIGAAIEVFGQYKKIIDYEGKEISAGALLGRVQKIVTDYTVKQLLDDKIGEELSPLTRFYLLWRWTYGNAKASFDVAEKLAQTVGINLKEECNKGFVKEEKEFIRVLGPQGRTLEEIGDSTEMIDVLHKALLLWKDGRKEKMESILQETGYGGQETFYKFAQAIAETLKGDNEEKRLLIGFLNERNRLMKQARNKEAELWKQNP